MDIISTVIDLYFRVMESLNVRNVSVAILVLIIGIEFIEFFAEKDEAENVGERRRAKKPDVKKMLGLARGRNGVLMVADETGAGDASKSVSASSHPTKTRRPSLKALGFTSEDGAEVIGSRTYTIRTVLDGNHIYLEKVEEQPNR
jgi:hypothetical protein